MFEVLKAKEDQRQQSLPRACRGKDRVNLFMGWKWGIVPHMIHYFDVDGYDALLFDAMIAPEHKIDHYVTVQ